MGFDIGFHAIDKKDIDDVISYIIGEKENLDYLDKVGDVAKSRYIANAWGLASMKVVEGFDSNLYVWGRPFFVTDNENLEAIIKKYITAKDSEAIQIAKSQFDFLKGDESKLSTPDTSKMPTANEFKQNAVWKLDLFKTAFDAIKEKKETITDPAGNEHDPVALFSSDFHLSMIESIAYKSPTWMARGHVWPSLLLDEAAGDLSFFEDSSSLTKALVDKESEIKFYEDNTITQNYKIGGIVSPQNLLAFKESMSKNSENIITKAKKEDWEPYALLAIKKINECIDYCIDNNLYFVESSDIYSAPMGIIS